MKKELKKLYPTTTFVGGLDNAIVGVDRSGSIIYSYNRCYEILQKKMASSDVNRYLEKVFTSLQMKHHPPVYIYEHY